MSGFEMHRLRILDRPLSNKEMKALVPKQEELWITIEQYLMRTHGGSYDKATQILCQLKSVAEYEGKLVDFQQRIDELVKSYPRREAFIRRLKAAALIKSI